MIGVLNFDCSNYCDVRTDWRGSVSGGEEVVVDHHQSSGYQIINVDVIEPEPLDIINNDGLVIDYEQPSFDDINLETQEEIDNSEPESEIKQENIITQEDTGNLVIGQIKNFFKSSFGMFKYNKNIKLEKENPEDKIVEKDGKSNVDVNIYIPWLIILLIVILFDRFRKLL